jgi:hypothetical protein
MTTQCAYANCSMPSNRRADVSSRNGSDQFLPQLYRRVRFRRKLSGWAGAALAGYGRAGDAVVVTTIYGHAARSPITPPRAGRSLWAASQMVHVEGGIGGKIRVCPFCR